MSFGDFFSPAARLESIRRQLISGQILYLYCDFTIPDPKNKYLVLASTEPRLLFLVINSDQRELVRSNPRWQQAQVSISTVDYQFLDHESWIDCTDVQELSQEEVESQLGRDMSRIKGQLSHDTLAAVIDAVAESPGLINREKRWILVALHIALARLDLAE
ncbi:MAG: hypothetical protein DMF61_23615 [Blastocatellia bacterium AA13]|nr:MAG: hypothetical protein DMF61_23615 [Blastocatellia bacterium AA13]